MKDNAYKIVINAKYDGYQRELANMIYKVFDKKSRSGVHVNEELPQELHNQWVKISKEGKCMQGLKITFRQ